MPTKPDNFRASNKHFLVFSVSVEDLETQAYFFYSSRLKNHQETSTMRDNSPSVRTSTQFASLEGTRRIGEPVEKNMPRSSEHLEITNDTTNNS